MKWVLSLVVAVFSVTAYAQTTSSWGSASQAFWHDASNWSAGVPDISTVAMIASNGSCVVTGTAYASQVSISSSVTSTFVITNDATLFVSNRFASGRANMYALNNMGTLEFLAPTGNQFSLPGNANTIGEGVIIMKGSGTISQCHPTWNWVPYNRVVLATNGSVVTFGSSSQWFKGITVLGGSIGGIRISSFTESNTLSASAPSLAGSAHLSNDGGTTNTLSISNLTFSAGYSAVDVSGRFKAQDGMSLASPMILRLNSGSYLKFDGGSIPIPVMRISSTLIATNLSGIELNLQSQHSAAGWSQVFSGAVVRVSRAVFSAAAAFVAYDGSDVAIDSCVVSNSTSVGFNFGSTKLGTVDVAGAMNLTGAMGAGKVTVFSGSLTANANTLIAGDVSLHGGTFNGGGAAIYATNVVTHSAGVWNHGTGTVYLLGANSNLTNYYSLVPVGSVTLTNADISIAGTLTSQPGASVNAAGGTLTLSNPGLVDGNLQRATVTGNVLRLDGIADKSRGQLNAPRQGRR